MEDLYHIVEYIDDYLDVKNIQDYKMAFNGLQVTSSAKVKKIVCSVDASLNVIKSAVKKQADLLIVHHGLFWQKERRLIGSNYDKIKLLIENNIALYSSHLPLDIHHEVGNNKLLCDVLKVRNKENFLKLNDMFLGIKGDVSINFDDLINEIKINIGSDIYYKKNRSDDSDSVGTLGVITGGAGDQIYDVSKYDINTFLTGEGSHWTFSAAQELGINLIYAGHYNTEVFGVKALSELLGKKYNLDWEFIDLPSGL